jgi:hypothetical protein
MEDTTNPVLNADEEEEKTDGASTETSDEL